MSYSTRLTRAEAEEIVANRESLCCGFPMKLEVHEVVGRFSAFAVCPRHSWGSWHGDEHEAACIGDLRR